MKSVKWCPDCGEYRPVSEFYPDLKAADRLRTYCKKHSQIRNRQWVNTHRDRVTGYNREYMRKRRAKEKGLTTQSKEDMIDG